jgi:hypothetical protein
MRCQRRHICLFVDNFSAHNVDYKPQHIQLEFFEPNLTSHVQPCDAGIIRTLKAFYRKAFCLRAIEKDGAGEREIYKVDLLEAILMAKQAWEEVSPSTITHCWNHAKIQPESNESNSTLPATVAMPTPSNISSPMTNRKAWDLVRTFATSENMTLPQVEEGLRTLLGVSYVERDWQPILKVVMDAERDTEKALEGLTKFEAAVFDSISNTS